VVGQGACPVEYSSHLGVESGFATSSGVVVAHTFVGPTGGQVVLGDEVHSWIISSI
jgi:hypothetical protein